MTLINGLDYLYVPREPNSCYHNSKTILFAMYPSGGNLIQVPIIPKPDPEGSKDS